MSGRWLPRCLVLGLLGCGAGEPELTAAYRAAIADSVRQAWEAMMAGARALNSDRIRAGYVAKPIVAINGVIVDSFERRSDSTQQWLGSLRSFDATYDNVHLEVLAPDAVVATMNHHLRWTDTTGAYGEWHSAWTAVFRRVEGGWKISYSHESVTPAEPR